MNNKPIAIVLGGTVPHIRLIKNLQSRGYYAILLDYLEYSPAKPFADEHIQESTLDKELVLKIATERNVDLVISTCIDQANVTACYVAEKLGLPAPYSFEVALEVTNKGKMKEKMIANDIPTSKYIFVSDLEDFSKSGIKFPVAVKPSDSNSSKGVRKADNIDELKNYLAKALQVSRDGKAIIEEYKIGREIGMDCFIQNNEVTIFMSRERRKVVNEGDPIQQIQGSYWPAGLSDKNLADYKKIIKDIAKAFNLNNTSFMLQSILSTEDEISIIEFAPRIGGGENYNIIELYCGHDVVQTSISSFLKQEADLTYSPNEYLYADIYLYTEPKVFGEIKGYREIVKNGLVEYFNVYKKQGAQIGPEMSSNNRVGAFVAKGKTRPELLEKIFEALKQIEIYDVDGASMMKKEIYNKQ